MSADPERDVLASLSQRKPNTPVSIAADLANDNLNSICRLSLAWISSGKIHGVSYFVKPLDAEFTNRKVTAEMVKNSLSFADLWDKEISLLLRNAILAAYSAETLFTAIKNSYEVSGRTFSMNDAYVRDVKFLASAYIAGLGNNSFASIMHYLNIPVDLDNSLSRAMACSFCIRSLERMYPIESYGIPLSAIMAGVLRQPSAETTRRYEERRKKYTFLANRIQAWLLPFLILCLVLTLYYLHRYQEKERTNVDFSRYTVTINLPASEITDVNRLSPMKNNEYPAHHRSHIISTNTPIPTDLSSVKEIDVKTIFSS